MIVQKPGFLPKDALQPGDYVKNPVPISQSAIANCLIKKPNTQIPNFFKKSGDLI